jgi:hypothetical protein
MEVGVRVVLGLRLRIGVLRRVVPMHWRWLQVAQLASLLVVGVVGKVVVGLVLVERVVDVHGVVVPMRQYWLTGRVVDWGSRLWSVVLAEQLIEVDKVCSL